MTLPPIPHEAGYFWATDLENSLDFNLIVEVYGLPPFLQIKAHDIKKMTHKNITLDEVKQWGPEIEIPKPVWV